MNTIQKLTLYLTVFFSLSLVACAPAIPPAPTSLPAPIQASKTLEPTRTATSINPPLTPRPQQLTAAEQLTQAAYGRATATARAIANPLSISTPQIRPTLFPLPSPPILEPTALIEAIEAARQPENVWTATSPDGQWVATVINQICADVGPEGTIYEQIKFSRTDNSSGWVLVEEISICGVGYGYYAPIGWSPNSHYFYFASISVPDGCGFLAGGDPVLQVEMTNHQVTLVNTATDWKISPDQKTLALTSGNDLVLWEMDLGETARVMLNAPGTGEQVIWKPDGSALMVTTAETVYCELPKNSSIVRVDLPGLEQTTYFTADTRLLFAAEWLDSGMIVLRTFNYGNQPTWLLNPQTGEITPQQ